MKKHDANLGVDIGGTFTDLVLEIGGQIFSTKFLTTIGAPEDAILAGLAQVCADASIRLALRPDAKHSTQ